MAHIKLCRIVTEIETKSDECHCNRKELAMIEKDYQLYGTKILNLKTKEIGLLICIWKNKFADGEVDFATCVDK